MDHERVRRYVKLAEECPHSLDTSEARAWFREQLGEKELLTAITDLGELFENITKVFEQIAHTAATTLTALVEYVLPFAQELAKYEEGVEDDDDDRTAEEAPCRCSL